VIAMTNAITKTHVRQVSANQRIKTVLSISIVSLTTSARIISASQLLMIRYVWRTDSVFMGNIV